MTLASICRCARTVLDPEERAFIRQRGRRFDDFAKRMMDEIVWWANTLKEGRSGDEVAEAA